MTLRTIENFRLVDGEKLDNLPANPNAALALKEDKANKGQANGYASLDGGGKVPLSQLPVVPGSGDMMAAVYDPAGGAKQVAFADEVVSSINGQTGDVVLNQDDIGDGTTYKQFSQLEKTRLGVNSSTRYISGTGVTINAGDNTKFDVNLVGEIKDGGVIYPVSVSQTGVTATYIASQTESYVIIDKNGTIIQQLTTPTSEQLYNHLGYYVLVHSNLTNLNVVNNYFNRSDNSVNQLHAHMRKNGFRNIGNGNTYSANGANLKLNKSAGSVEWPGIGTASNPNEISNAAQTALTFRIRMQNGVETADVTDLDTSNYDVGGVVTPLPSGTNWYMTYRIALFPASNTTRLQRPQTYYSTMNEAIINAGRETGYVVDGNIERNAMIAGYIVVKKGTTALDSGDANVRFLPPLEGGGGGGGFTPTLQAVYDVSNQPQITTNADKGAVQIKNGEGDDTTYTSEWLNNAGTKVAGIRGDGSIVSKTITITDDTSSQGQVLPDLSNIVRAATTANITLSGTQTIDGVSLVANDLVLVKNQSTGSQNGVYVVSAGAWTRATNYNTTDHFNRRYIYAISGTTNTATLWICSTRNPTVGTTATSFAQVPLGIGTGATQAAAGNHTHTSIATTAASSIGAALSYRYTNRTATATTATTDLVVEFTGSTASQIETMPDGVALSNNSGRILVYRNSATVPWTIRQSASNTLDGSSADYTLAVGETLTVLNKADNVWISLNKPVGGSGSTQIRKMFAVGGTIGATGVNVANTVVMDGTYTLTRCNLWYGTAGNGTLTIDVNKNGTTVYATTKPGITATNQSSINSGTITTAGCVSGDVYTIDIDAVPGTPGTDLFVELVFTS